jgi:hypothetical protein
MPVGVPASCMKTLKSRYLTHGSLDILSNELLLLISEYLFSDVRACFDDEQRHSSLGSLNAFPRDLQNNIGLPSNIKEDIDGVHFNIELYQDDSALSLIGLRGLASTSRRFRAIAQPMLFRAPVLSIGKYGHWNERSPIYLFARTLLEQPDLAKWTTTLRIDMPESWGGTMQTRVSEPLEVHRMAVTVIDALDWLDHDNKTGWKWQLQRLRPLPFCAIILALVPHLRELYLSRSCGSKDDLISDLFWSTSAHFMTEEEHDQALRSLVKCPGLINLKHFRTDSMIPLFQSPLMDIVSLVSLDFTSRNPVHLNLDVPLGVPLNRIRNLRMNCNLDQAIMELSSILPLLPQLETLELYATTLDNEQIIDRSIFKTDYYSMLVEHCCAVASTLRKLELPHGWWTSPNVDLSYAVHVNQFTSSIDPFNASQLPPTNQPTAHTSSIADFTPFLHLETLIVHATALIAKDTHDTTIANPTLTLPPSIKHITVYGAHDELWSWIGDMLTHRGSHFRSLQSITLLRDEWFGRERLSSLREMKASHEALWDVIRGSRVVLRGDI